MSKTFAGRSGGAGLIVAVIALVLAVSGSAIAAKGNPGLSAKQKKQVTAIAKGLVQAGPAGTAGKDGANGANGANGQPGAPGTPGADGESIELFEAEGAECGSRGGAILVDEEELEVEVCTGLKGAPGSAWVPDGFLPPGAQETGAWSFRGQLQTFTTEVGGTPEQVTVGDPSVWVPNSFAVKLDSNMGGTSKKFHFEGEASFADFDEGGAGTIGCTGTTDIPTAPEGHLCVYAAGGISGATFSGFKQPGGFAKGVGRAGFALTFTVTDTAEATDTAFGSGTWAVGGFDAP